MTPDHQGAGAGRAPRFEPPIDSRSAFAHAIDGGQNLSVGHPLVAALDGDLVAASLLDVAIDEPRRGV
jgi:hypothetical protein